MLPHEGKETNLTAWGDANAPRGKGSAAPDGLVPLAAPRAKHFDFSFF